MVTHLHLRVVWLLSCYDSRVWVVAREVVWPAKSKIFIIQSLMERFCVSRSQFLDLEILPWHFSA